MIGLDTNVLVRYVTRDDESAFQVASKLIRSALASGEDVQISSVVHLECEWVLRSRYGHSKDEVISLFTAFLTSREIVFDDDPLRKLRVDTVKGVHGSAMDPCRASQ